MLRSFSAGRLESFFGPVTKVASTSGAKRKDDKPPAKGANKKGKAGGVGGKKK